MFFWVLASDFKINGTMKTIISLFLLVTGYFAYSQSNLNKLSVSPIQLIGYNRLNVEFERGFNEGRTGVAFYFGQTGNASRKIHNEFSTLSEQNATLKFYNKAIDKSCFWYGTSVSVSSGNLYSADKADSTINIGALGVLGTGGYQFFVRSFYVNTYVSAGYSFTNNLFGSAVFDPDLGKPSNWLLAYGFKIGFKF